MSHAVETMFSVREVPWHGLGTVLRDPPTVADAILASGLDWHVDMVPAVPVDQVHVTTGHYFTRRATDGSILGCVGKDYRPLQNLEAFRWFQPWLETGAAHLTAAGSLHRGRVVWVQAEIGQPLEIRPGDHVRRYILLSHGHDGGTSIRAGFSPQRVVCANTLAMAHRDQASKLIRIRHTAGAAQSLADVRETMVLANSAFEATADQYRRLTVKTVNQDDVRKYVKQILGMPEKDEDLSGRARNTLERVLSLVTSGAGQDGTLTPWSAYNGVSEYLTHERGRSADTRVDSLWFGAGQQALGLALDLALQMAS